MQRYVIYSDIQNFYYPRAHLPVSCHCGFYFSCLTENMVNEWQTVRFFKRNDVTLPKFNRIVKLNQFPVYKIVDKERFSEHVYRLEVEAPMIARSRRPGHFVIVRVGDGGERIPLTIADADIDRGTITLVVQEVGVSTRTICALCPGDSLADIVGPLGQATHVEKVGTVVCCGGGVGVAPLLPIVKAMKNAGNRVITILAARSADLIILKDQVAPYSDEVIVMTDDGSAGRKGLVTEGLESVIGREKVDQVVAIGPAVMMKFVSLLTKKYEIPTMVSLNTIMVDGTGMCGACRVTVDGKTRFVCIDGPEFDAHKVDFDEMIMRLRSYN